MKSAIVALVFNRIGWIVFHPFFKEAPYEECNRCTGFLCDVERCCPCSSKAGLYIFNSYLLLTPPILRRAAVTRSGVRPRRTTWLPTTSPGMCGIGIGTFEGVGYGKNPNCNTCTPSGNMSLTGDASARGPERNVVSRSFVALSRFF
jgi:hypothetical protein